ncbi:MAG: bifunctional phosphoribosylaminoimidazolecarboxamide formyltransferase/IMP cyclohydrolase [Eubacteriales bacterium]|nr:bifunctional phosphoribosylaminoimidazolecarboxamide formyltransferase/IMP cyclohydrolase [Eubacteriales bacterium]
MEKRALISVSDKSALAELAAGLTEAGYKIYSTGGTRKALREAGFESVEVAEFTAFPELLSGRLKTLHPKVFAGILARPDHPADVAEMSEHDLPYFDLVAVNLYPFKEHLLQKKSFTEQIEQIDIGGPSLLRAAAKNHAHITVIIDPCDYPQVLAELANGGVSAELRLALAAKVFRETAAYDSIIADYFAEQSGALGNLVKTDLITKAWELKEELRYGENPQQKAEVYAEVIPKAGTILTAEQLQGKQLSFNNYGDANAAVAALGDFTRPTVVGLKHANPCGLASAESIEEAWELAYAADPVSIFGGIVAQNRVLTAAEAEAMAEIFLEIIIAPDFTPEALEILKAKKNLRLLRLAELGQPLAETAREWRFIDGGLLIQDYDNQPISAEDFNCVTKTKVKAEEIAEYHFAAKLCRLLKSNAISISRGEQSLGIGPGQTNRVGAAKIALEMAGAKARGAILASDAFFPFKDTLELAHKYGIRGVIQPGGSIRDQESIDFCDEHGIAMVFTSVRHFKH